MSTTDELWDLLSNEASSPGLPPVPDPDGQGRPEEPRVVPGRARAGRRRRLGRLARWLALAAVVSLAGAVGTSLWPRGSGGQPAGPIAPTRPGERVVAWTVWDDRHPEDTFVAVLAAGGDRAPMALAVPVETVTSLPGRGLGTVGQVASTGDADQVATVAENLLGVHIVASEVTPLPELPALVDAAGGIDIEGERMRGRQVLRYLSRGDAASPEGFFRWQVVLAGLVPSGARDAPDGLEPVFQAADGRQVDVIGFPVRDVGAGVVRPDEEAVAELVARRFGAGVVPGRKIRLVVLNGNGTPGIGAEVARVLVPEGFRLMASSNARTFDMRKTTIVASSREDLPYARKAKLLLGVGRIYLGNQPTGLADVTVVVGDDFGGA